MRRGKLVLLIDRDFCGKRGIETRKCEKTKNRKRKKGGVFSFFFSFSCGNNKFILNMRRGITSFPVYVLTYVCIFYYDMYVIRSTQVEFFITFYHSECTAKSLERNLVKKIHMICM